MRVPILALCLLATPLVAEDGALEDILRRLDAETAEAREAAQADLEDWVVDSDGRGVEALHRRADGTSPEVGTRIQKALELRGLPDRMRPVVTLLETLGILDPSNARAVLGLPGLEPDTDFDGVLDPEKAIDTRSAEEHIRIGLQTLPRAVLYAAWAMKRGRWRQAADLLETTEAVYARRRDAMNRVGGGRTVYLSSTTLVEAVVWNLRELAYLAAFEGEPRTALLDRWRKIADLTNDAFAPRPLEVAASYESLIEEDRGWTMPTDEQLSGMEPAERAAHLVHQLRDATHAGEGHATNAVRLGPDPVNDLLNVGWDAIPALIAHLDDTRPTRVPLGGALMTHAQICSNLLEEIGGCLFASAQLDLKAAVDSLPRPTAADQPAPASARQLAETWWKQAQGEGPEAQFLLLLRGDEPRYVTLAARRLLELDAERHLPGIVGMLSSSKCVARERLLDVVSPRLTADHRRWVETFLQCDELPYVLFAARWLWRTCRDERGVRAVMVPIVPRGVVTLKERVSTRSAPWPTETRSAPPRCTGPPSTCSSSTGRDPPWTRSIATREVGARTWPPPRLARRKGCVAGRSADPPRYRGGCPPQTGQWACRRRSISSSAQRASLSARARSASSRAAAARACAVAASAAFASARFSAFTAAASVSRARASAVRASDSALRASASSACFSASARCNAAASGAIHFPSTWIQPFAAICSSRVIHRPSYWTYPKASRACACSGSISRTLRNASSDCGVSPSRRAHCPSSCQPFASSPPSAAALSRYCLSGDISHRTVATSSFRIRVIPYAVSTT